MAASDARPIPRKNTAYRVTFPIYDADGDLVTGATGLDSELSGDAGTFADATNEATEIATSSGMYYLDLTAGEMNYDTVAIIVKTSSSGAKTTALVLYPEEAGDVRVDVVQISGDATAADNAEAYFDGTGYAGTNNVIPTVTNVTNLHASAATAAALATVDDFLDTEVAAILAAVDTEVAAIKAKTDSLTFSVAGMVDANVVDWKGATAPAMTGDAYARLGAPAGASVSADIADLPTVAEFEARTIAAATYATASALDAVDNYVDTEVAAIKAVTDKIDTALELDGAVYRYTVNALELAPTGGSAPSAETIADAVWDEALSGHSTAGTTGKKLTDLVNADLSGVATAAALATVDGIVDDILVDTGTTLPATLATIAGYIDTEVAAILADTNELQTDLTNGGRLDLLVDAIKAKTDLIPASPAATGDIPTAAAVADAVWDEATSGHTGAGTTGKALTDANNGTPPTASAIASQVRTELTTELGRIDVATSTRLATAGYTAPDNASITAILEDTGTTLPATLATIAGYIDTEVAAVLAAVDTEVAAILVDTGTTLDALLQDIPTNAELATALAGADDAVLAAIAALNNLSADNVLDEVVEGTTTMRQLLRLYAAVLLNKASGGGTTTIAYRDLGDTKDRVTLTVDADGNRSAVTLDGA